MAFHNDDSDLVYPNLVNCQITATNALVYANNDALPPPPAPFSTAKAESLLKTTSQKYDFKVEKQILARERERTQKSASSRGSGAGDIEHDSVEVTLSDLERKCG